MRTVGHWIDGRRFSGGADVVAIHDPATGQQIGETQLGGRDVVEEAVAAARRALPTWSETSLSRRTKVLFTFRELLAARTRDLATLVVEEHGKTFEDAIAEVGRALDVVEHACGLASELKGSYSDQASTGVDTYTFRSAVGVVAGITPFNFPAMVPAWMYPIAIACGNTFVLKPSERDPSPSLAVAEMWAEAGLPDGVFNVVQGDRATVEALLDHSGVDAVSFVGSTPVARRIHERASASGKRVQALGGAKNHAVVLPDADLDLAGDNIAAGAFGSAGERCMAVSVAVAVGNVADDLVDVLTKQAAHVRLGPGHDPDTDMGPVITAASRDRIERLIDAAELAGAKIPVDGRRAVVAGHEGGFFVGPTVVDDVATDMAIYTEEVFGPVVVVLRADTVDDALRLVNATPYGNGASVFTRDGGIARRFVRGVQVGMVGVNVPVPVPLAFHSFGGWKDSLIGEHHIHGPEGFRFYTRAKAVTVRWPAPSADEGAASFSMPTGR